MFNPQMTRAEAKASLVFLNVATNDETFIDQRLVQMASNPSLYLLSDNGNIYCISHDNGTGVEVEKVYSYKENYAFDVRLQTPEFITFMRRTFEHKAFRLEGKRLRDNPNITYYDFS